MDRRSSLKAALLDFDGTLVDLPVDWERLRTQISLAFADYGVAREFRPLVAGMTQAFAELKARGVPSHTRAGLHRRINRLVTEAEVEAARTAAPLPGSGELLERLRDEGWKTIIQTSNSVRAVETARLRLSWAAVDAVVGRESARRAKPDPQGVRTELRRLGLRGSECVVVGDGDFDVALGRAIGAKTVRVTNGEPPPATSVEADIEICSLKELLGLLDAELEPAGGVA